MEDREKSSSEGNNDPSPSQLSGKIKVALSLISLCESLVPACHSPDQTEMRQRVEAFLGEALTASPFVSQSEKAAQAQEKMVRDFAPFLLDYVHSPDGDQMLADLHKIAEALPGQFEQIHLSGGVAPDDPASLFFARLMYPAVPQQESKRKMFWQRWFNRDAK